MLWLLVWNGTWPQTPTNSKTCSRFLHLGLQYNIKKTLLDKYIEVPLSLNPQSIQLIKDYEDVPSQQVIESSFLPQSMQLKHDL